MWHFTYEEAAELKKKHPMMYDTAIRCLTGTTDAFLLLGFHGYILWLIKKGLKLTIFKNEDKRQKN